MRFIIYGAGAIGGVIGGRLFQHDHDVVLIARGPHFEAMRQGGLRLESPDETITLKVPVVNHPSRIAFGADDVVLLAMKTQDTAKALAALVASAPPDLPVACAQNGVENERLALRAFPNVYGISVMCPTAYLASGVVQAYSAPVTGLLDIGRHPQGTDDVAEELAMAFRTSGFQSEVRPDIVRWKYGKLLSNLGNAVEAVCGPPARQGPIAGLARQEALACFAAAGIDFVTDGDTPARTDLVKSRPIGTQKRPGGSSWQSLQRGAGSVETDYLNGEVVLLGRLTGVPTPVNALLQRLANEMAHEHRSPGLVAPEDFLAEVASIS